MINVSGYMAAWWCRADCPMRYPELLHIERSVVHAKLNMTQPSTQ